MTAAYSGALIERKLVTRALGGGGGGGMGCSRIGGGGGAGGGGGGGGGGKGMWLQCAECDGKCSTAGGLVKERYCW